jgi:hypothetical protein
MVAVSGSRMADEPVVEVVVDGRGEHPVETEDVGGLVVLILVAASARDLDDDFDDRREVVRTRAHDADTTGIVGV